VKDGPDIAAIAALIGDPARANMLLALMGGRALTASELAAEAGVTRPTASAHLARLSGGCLIAGIAEGRHRYFRIADAEAAAAIEALIGLAEARGGSRVRPGPNDAAMRRARVCYDHLAGEVAVEMLDAMVRCGWVAPVAAEPALTDAGRRALAAAGIDVAGAEEGRRPPCRLCLDWSQRRHHLAGAVGKAILDRILAAGWGVRRPGSRVVGFAARGETAFRQALVPG
jgi:DNA-binding transcriptional ArsR family regulator